MTKLKLTDDEFQTLINALYVAKQSCRYDSLEADERHARIRDAFQREHDKISNLIAKVEDRPDEDQ